MKFNTYLKSKTGFSIIELLVVVAVLAIFCAIIANQAFAADLTYSSRVQTGDTPTVIGNKSATAISRLEFGNNWTNITANGTNSLGAGVTLDRVQVNTSGTTSTLVLREVTSAGATNVIATASTTAQGTLDYGIRVTGTLQAVSAGGAAHNVTISYR